MAEIARTAVYDGAPLDDLARAVELRSATIFDVSEPYHAHDIAFALALTRRPAG